MQPPKKVIHIVKHSPTGAEVPMHIEKINKENVIEKYKEATEGRKYYTVKMLMDRWKLDNVSDVIKLLQDYKVPAHVNHDDVKSLPTGHLPIEVAIFFEEYIHGLEQKSKIGHVKLKSRCFKEKIK
jgi:hypothetical protein